MITEDTKKGGDAGAMVGQNYNTFYDGLREKVEMSRDGGCERKPDILHNFKINLTYLDLKNGGLVQGKIEDGILYDYKGEDVCRSSEQHSFSGKFSLTIVSADVDEDLVPLIKPKITPKHPRKSLYPNQ